MNTGTIFIRLSLILNIILFVYLCFIFIKKYENRKILDIFYLASGFAFTVSVILLFAAFLTDRFDLTYVYNYSSRDLPVFFKIAAFWAGQEGTFLLWSFILFILGCFE